MAQRTGREAQAQTFGQGVAARQLPFSQLGGLKGLMQAPGFNPAGTAAPADLTGAARDLFSGQMQGYGANQGKKGSSVGGLGQLGMGAGMLAMASDERVKENVERLPIEASPDEAPGVPVAIFEYVWAPGEKRIGVIAQDLEKVRPDLVIQLPGGMRMVNYVGLKGFLKAVAWRQ